MYTDEAVKNKDEFECSARQLRGVGVWSLANKIALWFSLLVVFAFGAVLYYSVHQDRELLLANKLDEVAFEAADKINRFSAEVVHAEHDVLFLAAAPSVAGIIQALNANEGGVKGANNLAEWRSQLEQLFSQFLMQHSAYFQIRFLGGGNRGTELVRIERSPYGSIRAVPQGELQDKSQRDYVRDTLTLPPGEVRYSRINLNREHGVVVKPHIPTVRVSTPIYSNGEVFGLLVINLDLTAALKEYAGQFSWPARVSMVDDQGVLLAHDEPHKTFGADIGTQYRLASESPQAWEIMSTLLLADGENIVSDTSVGPDLIRYVAWFSMMERNKGPRLGTVIEVSKSNMFEGINGKLRKTIILALLVMAFSVFLIWLLSRTAVMPLARLAEEVRAYGHGDEVTPLLLEREDEVGGLAKAFHGMREQISERSLRLTQQEQRLRSIVEYALDGIILTDRAGIILDINPAAEFLFGYDEWELLGENISVLIPPPSWEPHDRCVADYLCCLGEELVGAGREMQGVRRDGVLIDIRLTLSTYEIEGETFFTAMVYDIGDYKHLELELRKSNEFLEERVYKRTKELEKSNLDLRAEVERHRITRARLFVANKIFEKTPQAIVICDANNVIRDVNPAYTSMTGYRCDDVIGCNPSISKSDHHDSAFYCAMWKSIAERNHWEGEIWDRRKDGEIFPKYLTIDRILDENDEVLNYVATFYDLSEQKETEAELERRTNYDPLTMLPNIDMFKSRLELECKLADRYHRKLGLFILNIDRFKQVNDSFGYRQGDHLLCEVGKRLQEHLRHMDILVQGKTDGEQHGDILSRMGGDNFAFMITDLGEESNAAIAAQRIITRIEQPFNVAGQDVFLSCSIGISIFPDNATNIDAQLLCAERALHKARELGGGQYKFYSDEMNCSSLKQVQMEADLRRAVLANTLRLHYQPKLYLDSGEIVGMEALVRWPTRDGGQVYPDEFIPLAESTGLIIPLGRWIMRQACLDTQLLNKRHGWNLKVAINLSMRQFQQLDLIAMVKEVLDDTDIAPTNVEFEITESMVMIDQEQALKMMRGLKKLGVILSIDDFGTGYSSLAYLRRFPVDALKIDRSFVSNLGEDYEDASIVSAICSLGRSLGLLVVAEGVETEEHLQFLQENSCDMAQGYHISRALPVDEFEAFIQGYSEG